MPTFTPPYVIEPATDEPGMFRKMKMQRSVTVVKNGSSYRTVRYDSPEDLATADIAYFGGHTYQISTAEGDALTAAGYTVLPDNYTVVDNGDGTATISGIAVMDNGNGTANIADDRIFTHLGFGTAEIPNG